ncbi:MAG: BamA/TamA family outer membrane protein [Bacteroidota bacterium]
MLQSIYSHLRRHLAIPALSAFMMCSSIFAQEENAVPVRAEITNLHIAIDGDFSTDQILNELVTSETPWGGWIFLNENITQNLGAPRSYFDPLIFYNDIVHLYDYFSDRGYFKTVIDTTLIFKEGSRSVDIALHIIVGQRSMVDSVNVYGLNDLPQELRNRIEHERILKPGDPYNKQNVIDEQNRILRLLHANGYPLAKLEGGSQRRYASTNNISVTLKFDAGEKFVFGDVVIVEGYSPVDQDIVLRQLDFETGQIYNEEKRNVSEQNLNRLGIFETAEIKPDFVVDSAGNATVPLTISYRTLEMQEVTPEFLVLSENNELFSTGLGLGYKHRNFFGGARNFSITARARVNRIEDLDINGAFKNGLSEPSLFSKADIQSQLVFPYFYSNKTAASITLTAEAEKQPDYTLNTLRAKLGLNTKLATYTNGVTELSIERVDPKFKDAQNLRVEDTTKQFNVIEAFTLQRDKTNNIFSPTSGFFHSATIEEAGVVSKLVNGFNLPYSEYVKVSFLLKHFFSGGATQSHVFALKLQGGLAQLYNSANTTPVPLPRRFFVGGSGSVRAWKDKQLSAFGDTLKGGNIAFEGSMESRSQLFPNGGKFLVLNLENLWSVLFLDFGNTWYKVDDVDLEQVACAVGFGLRYETFVGPFRFDVAWRLYDPKKPIGQQWLYEQSLFHNSFSIVHFGIGHAF